MTDLFQSDYSLYGALKTISRAIEFLFIFIILVFHYKILALLETRTNLVKLITSKSNNKFKNHFLSHLG